MIEFDVDDAEDLSYKIFSIAILDINLSIYRLSIAFLLDTLKFVLYKRSIYSRSQFVLAIDLFCENISISYKY